MAVQEFTDLEVWQQSQSLAVLIYKTTSNFPKSEQFGLTSQMRRSAVSVPSNIAEGFNRFSDKEKLHFYSIALGSVSELQSQILICEEIGYLRPDHKDKFLKQVQSIRKLLFGLLRSTRKDV